jgi:hypothetical protein
VTLRTHAASIPKLGAFLSATTLPFYTFATYFAILHRTAVVCPLVGIYADFVGRKKPMPTKYTVVIVAVYPSFFWRVQDISYRLLLASACWPLVRALGCSHRSFVIGRIPDLDELHGICHYLQPRLYGIRWDLAARRYMVDFIDRKQYCARFFT